jgi:hypothetical protein
MTGRPARAAGFFMPATAGKKTAGEKKPAARAGFWKLRRDQ